MQMRSYIATLAGLAVIVIAAYNVQPAMISNRLRNVGAGKPSWDSYKWAAD